MKRLSRLGLVVAILIACVGCDQATKSIAKKALISSPPISLLGGAIRIEYSENPGAILGLGANLPEGARLLFSGVFAGIVLAAALAFAAKPQILGLLPLAGLSLVAAGGIGNLLDRIFNEGSVIDFISLGIGPLRTGIFNVADVAIFAGVPIFLLFNKMDKAKVNAA